MKEQLLDIKAQAQKELDAIKDLTGLESFRITYLGKKGHLTAIMKRLGALSAEERPEAGKLANQVKIEITHLLEMAHKRLESEKATKTSHFDVSLPGRRPARGHLHPISQVNREICDIFVKMGYKIVKGPDVELDYYNFEALNFPKDHPARDMQDTFYVSDGVVLRTQTSPMQVRVMESQQPPDT